MRINATLRWKCHEYVESNTQYFCSILCTKVNKYSHITATNVSIIMCDLGMKIINIKPSDKV